MTLVIGFVGWIAGMLIWSNILGSLFATLPLAVRLKKANVISEIRWVQIVGPITVGLITLIASYFISGTFFFATLVGGVTILFNIHNLKREALQNAVRDYPELRSQLNAASEVVNDPHKILK